MKFPESHEEAFRLMLAKWEPLDLHMPNGERTILSPNEEASLYVVSSNGLHIGIKPDGTWGVISDITRLK